LLGSVLAVLALVFAAVLHQAHAAESEPILPNLVADPPDGAELTTDSSTGTTQLLLRFNGYVHNVGPGALDFQGAREAPKVSQQTEEEVERARREERVLPPSVEAELASPAMKVFQRLFTTNADETDIERAHIEEPSGGEMLYVNADGHHHWHLQRVAQYSLWNAGKTAEVAPSQKVGFCLEDSQHVETNIGPQAPVYASDVYPYEEFCARYRPNATSLHEGISPGWRDTYGAGLAFQWVNVSNVAPGEYWLREDVNPLGVIKETGGPNTPAYAASPTIIPGFDALPQAASTPFGQATTLTLTAESFADSATPTYTIVTQPAHGTLTAVSGNHVAYTPAPGYSGPDSFTFAAADPNSQFPEQPAVATVSIEVGEGPPPVEEPKLEEPPQPSVTIATAPAGMTAGTSAALTATVANYEGSVEWSVGGGGTVAAEGLQGLDATFKAPLGEGSVTITARLAADPAVSATRTIEIQPVPPVQAAPELPPVLPTSAGEGANKKTTPEAGKSTPETGKASPASGSTGATGVGGFKAAQLPQTAQAPPGLSRPRAMLVDRELVMTTVASVAGRVRLSAYLGKRRLGSCVAQTPARRRFTCRVPLHSKNPSRERIALVASLRAGGRLLAIAQPAELIPGMAMTPIGDLPRSARAASYSSAFWCSPSTLVGTLAGGES
jgi:hypothetical protein